MRECNGARRELDDKRRECLGGAARRGALYRGEERELSSAAQGGDESHSSLSQSPTRSDSSSVQIQEASDLIRLPHIGDPD